MSDIINMVDTFDGDDLALYRAISALIGISDSGFATQRLPATGRDLLMSAMARLNKRNAQSVNDVYELVRQANRGNELESALRAVIGAHDQFMLAAPHMREEPDALTSACETARSVLSAAVSLSPHATQFSEVSA